MRIIVCVKQVPDTSGRVAVKPDGTLDRASMQTIANPDDMSALEAALTIKGQLGGTVCVMSMGPFAAEDMLREMLAMGADEAVLVSGREFSGSDTYATSQVLAAAISAYGVDDETLILCGRQAIDGDTAQVGPQIAEKLNIPQVTYVAAVKAEGKNLICKSLTEDGYVMVSVGTPCLLTCVKEMNTPRYMNVPGIMTAYKKVLTVYDYNRLKDNPLLDGSKIGLMGSPTNIYKSFTPRQRGKKLLMLSADRIGCAAAAEQLSKNFIIPRGV